MTIPSLMVSFLPLSQMVLHHYIPEKHAAILRLLKYIAVSTKETVRSKQRRSIISHEATMLATTQVGLKGRISTALVLSNVLYGLTLWMDTHTRLAGG